jgi:rubrerythrin
LKKSDLFLPAMSEDKKDFLNLLDLTAKVHGELRLQYSPENPFWGETFFRLDKSSFWKTLPEHEQNKILHDLSSQILQEAFFIENAGMAYSAKMNLLAQTKEERQFYCFVAEEETKHLRMIESLSNFDKSVDAIPSFARLIGNIIDNASAPASLLLIQILLEGWGLNYYKSLQKESRDQVASGVFKAILKDEIRHHSAGVILFSSYHIVPESVVKEFQSYLHSVVEMVSIGPLRVTRSIFEGRRIGKEVIKNFLLEIEAIEESKEKIELIHSLFLKSLDNSIYRSLFDEFKFQSLEIDEMTSWHMNLFS